MPVQPTIRRMRRLLCASCLALPTTSAAQQATQADSANVVLAHRLLKAMHFEENMVAMAGAAVSRQRQTNAQLAPVFYDSVLARMKRSTPELLDSIAPVYARRFSGPELEAMIQFYESPTGQTWAQKQGALASETMTFGQRWGARVGAAVAKDLVDAGVDINGH
jgi:uncharacterized protein